VAFTQDLFTSRRNQDDGTTRIGETDRLWYDSTTQTIRISDGTTPGGIIIAGEGVSGNYSNSNVASYLTVNNIGPYSNVNVANYLNTTSITGNLNLGNLYITDETIGGKIADRDITLLPAGSGFVSVPNLKLPVGSLVQQSASIEVIVDNLILDYVVDYSTSESDNLAAGDYGLPNGISGTGTGWCVYQFSTNPLPQLESEDVISGVNVPAYSNILYVGVGMYANIIITDKTIPFSVPMILPTPGETIYTVRPIVNASMTIATAVSTDISLSVGANARVITHGTISPIENDIYDLGTPTKRFKRLWMGAGSIFVQDETLGIDLRLTAIDGDFVIAGGAGLVVGQFTLHDNTIKITDPTRDIVIGIPTATGNIVFNRPIQVISGETGNPSFGVNRDGMTTISIPDLAIGKTALSITADTNSETYAVPQIAGGSLVHVTNKHNIPPLLTFDSFGDYAPLPVSLIGRRFRGTIAAPAVLQAGDNILTITAAGYANATTPTGLPTTSSARMLFVADETFNATSQAGHIEIFSQKIGGTGVEYKGLMLSHGGLVIPSVAQGGTGLGGITFADDSFQDTAWVPSDNVNKITTGVGFQNPGSYYGNVSLDTSDVHTLASDSYSLTITDTGSNNLRLQLAQEIAANSSPTFSNVTVNNMNVLGNLTYNTSATVFGKILYLANNSTSSTEINGGGIVLGNVLESYRRSLLYSTTGVHGDYWYTDATTGFQTEHIMTTDAWITGNIDIAGTGRFGGFYTGYNFPDASIQAFDSINSYAQIVHQNLSPGTVASTDFIATSNNGSDTEFYVDMGINGSNFDNTNPINSLGTSTNKNDAYLYIQGNLSNTSAPGGNLTIGTNTPGRTVKFIAGGGAANDVIATFSNTSLTTSVQIISTVATGTAPLVIASTTKVNNLYANRASYADRLNPGATINGTLFDGVTNIEIGANASLLTGTYLNSTVIGSSLTTVGNLVNLNVTGNVTANYVRTTSHGIFNANVYTNYIVASGRYLTELPSYAYSNANVNSYLSVTTASPGTESLTLSNGAFTFTPANLAIYAWSSNVANANVAMKGYVDSQISTVTNNWTSANTIQSNQINAITANIANLQASSTGNIRYFGSFWDNTTVTQNANLAIINTVPIANTYGNLGVTIASGNRITFSANGSYKLDYSLQFHNTGNKTNQVAVWVRKNGSDIAQSASYFSLPAQGSVNGYICAVGPFIDGTITSGDYYQLMWVGLDSHISLQGIAAKTGSGTVPPVPLAPSTIVMVTRV
jgi:hypothetical protein